MNRFTSIAALFALALIQLTAHAGIPPDEAPTVTVRFADLDLDHTPGAATMYRRLQHAVKQVCSPLQGRDLGKKERFDRCTVESMEASIAKVNRAVLTEYYRSVVDHHKPSVLLAKE
jgi:UrcA family protein